VAVEQVVVVAVRKEEKVRVKAKPMLPKPTLIRSVHTLPRDIAGTQERSASIVTARNCSPLDVKVGEKARVKERAKRGKAKAKAKVKRAKAKEKEKAKRVKVKEKVKGKENLKVKGVRKVHLPRMIAEQKSKRLYAQHLKGVNVVAAVDTVIARSCWPPKPIRYVTSSFLETARTVKSAGSRIITTCVRLPKEKQSPRGRQRLKGRSVALSSKFPDH
jgi:hypothetical protein